MQPAQWPKYKYLLLELWRPADVDLAHCVGVERTLARQQVFNSLEREMRQEHLERTTRREESLTTAEHAEIQAEAYAAFKQFVRNLGWNVADVPSKSTLLEAPVVEDASDAPELDSDEAEEADVEMEV